MNSFKILILLTIFLLVIPMVNATCEDSDGGKDYTTKGCITVCTYGDQGSGCGSFCDQCGDDKKTLTEGYCEGTESKTIKYECPERCSNGACRKVSGCGTWCRMLGISDNMLQFLVFLITIIILIAILLVFKFFLKK